MGHEPYARLYAALTIGIVVLYYAIEFSLRGLRPLQWWG